MVLEGNESSGCPETVELGIVKRQVNMILSSRVKEFISDTAFFDETRPEDDDELYELMEDFSSYLRSFKSLDR